MHHAINFVCARGMANADTPVSGIQVPRIRETDMKATFAISGALLAICSATTFAQDMSRDQLMQRPQPMQPGKHESMPAPRTGDASRGGVQSGNSGSGTLMQQREHGMSSDTPTHPPQSTGTMKQ
jgi:hypothetical protein